VKVQGHSKTNMAQAILDSEEDISTILKNYSVEEAFQISAKHGNFFVNSLSLRRKRRNYWKKSVAAGLCSKQQVDDYISSIVDEKREIKDFGAQKKNALLLFLLKTRESPSLLRKINAWPPEGVPRYLWICCMAPCQGFYAGFNCHNVGLLKKYRDVWHQDITETEMFKCKDSYLVRRSTLERWKAGVLSEEDREIFEYGKLIPLDDWIEVKEEVLTIWPILVECKGQLFICASHLALSPSARKTVSRFVTTRELKRLANLGPKGLSSSDKKPNKERDHQQEWLVHAWKAEIENNYIGRRLDEHMENLQGWIENEVVVRGVGDQAEVEGQVLIQEFEPIPDTDNAEENENENEKKMEKRMRPIRIQ